jgi:SAM-dependent methyltransferase
MPDFCPVCHATGFEVLLNEVELRREAALRECFVSDRLERMPSAPELKDLTDFAHDAPASILCCPACGLLVREEQLDPAAAYVEDSYDFSVIDRMLPRYVEAFRAKEEPYRGLLPEGSRVLEIGPHFGAFLKVAAEWGWRPEGVDIGKDTSAYLLSQGYVIHAQPVECCGFKSGAYDAVFVWNCFDQIADPAVALAESRRVTKDGGLFVLRTPNGRFYSACESVLRSSPLPALSDSVIAGLGYENLLAFPYLYGYDSHTLELIASAHGFERIGARDSDLIILPFPEVPSWMLAERRAFAAASRNLAAIRDAAAAGYLTGPWIEMTFRAI